MKDEISEQVKNNPLTKEESRVQFELITKQLGLKHSFDFNEAWDIGLEIRKRKEFREKISDLEKAITSIEGTTGDAMHKANPVKHTFAGGCYIREIYNPAHELIITKIHRKEHPFFLMKGEMSILTEEGIKYIEAPYHGITKPGTKRAIYSHSDCVFVTVHGGDWDESTGIENIEEEIIAKDLNDPAVTLEDLKLLKKKPIK